MVRQNQNRKAFRKCEHSSRVALVTSPEFLEFNLKHKLLTSEIKSKTQDKSNQQDQIREMVLRSGMKGNEKKLML